MGRLEFLDGLRGLAILGVILIHVGQQFSALPVPLEHFAAYGFRGVQLFFIVSALTLCVAHDGKTFHYKSFYARRFFRIAPMFYLAILFYVWLYGMGAHENVHDGYGYSDILLTALFLHGFQFSSLNSVVPGGWSIAAEMMFYLSFPFLIPLMRTLHRALMVLVIGTLFSVITNQLLKEDFAIFSHFGFFNQLPAFLCGITIFRLLKEGRIAALPRWTGVALAVGCFTIMCIFGMAGGVFHKNVLATFLLSGIVLGAAHIGGGIFNLSVMALIGRVSFSVYLVHFGVIYALHPLLAYLPPAQWLAFVVFLLVVTVLSVWVSMLTFRFIESPFIAFSRRLFVQNPARTAAPVI